MISYSFNDIIKVYEGSENLVIKIDGKEPGIQLAYKDGKKSKEFILQNSDKDFIETKNGRRKVKMDKNQIKLELTREDE
ncbi:hypothetical protein IJM86_02010 [bacterium]|jgi:hypothetical protein|nr:hypothetical protein [bacterium]